MPDYPGLGLPLRHLSWHGDGQYPVGAHGSCWAAKSNIPPIRELATMNIMDRLTDKEEWHKKIFDEAIVSRWREEALAIPDENFWELAIRDNMQSWNCKNEVTLRHDHMSGRLKPLTGILSEGSFDYVSHYRNTFLPYTHLSESVSRSFEEKQSIMKRLALFLHSMHAHPLRKQTTWSLPTSTILYVKPSRRSKLISLRNKTGIQILMKWFRTWYILQCPH